MNRSLNILISDAPYYIGESITATAALSPSAPGLMYIWIDQDGMVIDHGIDLTAVDFTISDGEFNRSVTVTVIEDNISINASIKYVCEYESESTPITTVDAIKRKRSNLELHRWLSYMPRWSFAHKSHLSSYAKLSDYSYSLITDIGAKSIIKSATNMHNAIETVDYNEYNYSLPVYKKTKLAISDVGKCENIGPIEYTTFDQYPVSGCYLEEDSLINYKYEFNTDESFERFSIPRECFLYLTSVDNNEDTIKIVGLNKKGQLVTDSLKLHPRISHKTINKYKAVIGIYSKSSFIISTLSESDSYITGYIDSKRITDMEGNYFEPFFSVDSIDPTVLNITKDNGIDVYKFKVGHPIDKFVVTENLDLFFISNQILYSAKMYLDVSINIGITSTYNNNDICDSNYEKVTDGDYIEIDINVNNIRKIGNHFSISFSNGAYKKWLTKEGLESSDRVIIDASTCANNLLIKKQKLNSEPYLFSTHIENIKEVFQAGVIDNNIDVYKICEDIYDIQIYNGHIYIMSTKTSEDRSEENVLDEVVSKLVDENLNLINSTSSQNTTFKLIPIRCCYATSSGSIIFPQKLNIKEVIYE